MDHLPITPDQYTQIEVRLKELVQLILPLHALLEGSLDDTADRLEEVIHALEQIAVGLKKTTTSMNERQQILIPTLEARFKIILEGQETQMQMLTDLHAWLGAPQRHTAAPHS